MENLQLEMVCCDICNWQVLLIEVFCIDCVLDVQFMVNLSFGMDNEFMILCVCVKYEFIFLSIWFINEFILDELGDVCLIVMIVFVQELC